MSESKDISRAVALLKLTLPEMNKRNIATTPENYAVWYEYVSGENSDLVNEVNLLDLNKTTFTTEVHRDLYNRYIASAKESAVNKLSEGVKEVINDFLGKLSSEGKGLNAYAQVLGEFSLSMEQANNIDAIKNMLGNLISETHKREEATSEMQNTLESMSAEMKKLRAEVARLNSETTTDALTKVNNRHAFDLDIEQVMSTANSENHPLTLIMLDVDGFGEFNRKFGKVIADKVLRFVATLFKKNIKGGDLIARLADDEFGILLPETDYEGALAVAENVRDKLAKQTLSDSAAKMQLGTITVSAGVASYQANEYAEDFIARAEACLKEARKEANIVVGERSITIDTDSNNVVL
jgi:diguanylate cyclase